MSWADDDFKVPDLKDAGVADSWEDEADDNDDPLLESWDVDIDELEQKKKEEAAKEKAAKEALKKKQEEERLKKKNKSNKPVLLEIDKVDSATRRKMLKEQQTRSDMKNSEDLFAGMKLDDGKKDDDDDIDSLFGGDDEEEEVPRGVTLTAESPLTAHPLFKAQNKEDYEKLRRGLEKEMERLQQENPLAYVNELSIDLITAMCLPMTVEQTRKVISTLNAQVTKKVKDERKARLSKTGGTSMGGAGKKKAKGKNLNLGANSFKKDTFDDMGDDDDYGDDDFM